MPKTIVIEEVLPGKKFTAHCEQLDGLAFGPSASAAIGALVETNAQKLGLKIKQKDK